MRGGGEKQKSSRHFYQVELQTTNRVAWVKGMQDKAEGMFKLY